MPEGKTQRDQAKELLRNRGIVRLSEFKAAGITAAAIGRMRDDGEVIRLARGLYQLPDAPLDANHSLAEAAKFQAMVALGLTNTRIKDYYDVWLLSQSFEFDETQLGRAIAATFERRETVIPRDIPDGLTPAFSQDEAKQRQWAAFARDVSVDPGSLDHVVKDLSKFLMPHAALAAEGEKK